MSNEKLAELRKQHGNLVEITVGGKTLAFRRANVAEYDLYQAKALKDEVAVGSRELCQQTLVYPDDLATLVQVFERWPLLPAKLKNEIEAISGGNIPVERAQHPDLEEVAKVTMPGGSLPAFVFRRPSLEEFEAYQAKLKPGVALGPINRAFCAELLAEPKGATEQLEKVFALAPQLSGAIVDVVAELCGSDIEITVKKG